MLKGPERMLLPDISGKGEGLTMEVNWNQLVTPCKYVKLRLKSEEVIVKQEHLESLIFALASEENQPKMLHGKINEVRELPVRLKIKATRDIHKGEDIVITHKMMIPIQKQF